MTLDIPGPNSNALRVSKTVVDQDALAAEEWLDAARYALVLGGALSVAIFGSIAVARYLPARFPFSAVISEWSLILAGVASATVYGQVLLSFAGNYFDGSPRVRLALAGSLASSVWPALCTYLAFRLVGAPLSDRMTSGLGIAALAGIAVHLSTWKFAAIAGRLSDSA